MSQHQLKTIAHATLILLEDGVPLLATDSWLIGSVYWRSWWLESYPSADEIDLVRRARELYVTHSHPDHFHWPSLRHLGPRTTLHPRFPRYDVPRFLEAHGFPSRVLEPWQWHPLSAEVKIASVPVPIDDSLLIIDTPETTIVNLNDAAPRRQLLQVLRTRLLSPGKPLVVLKSYSPASVAVSMFSEGKRMPIKSKQDYVYAARTMAETLGATHFIPFASQAFFSRTDSRWANEYKVTYEDLRSHWGTTPVNLVEPLVEMDLSSRNYRSNYGQISRLLDENKRTKVAKRESEEATFILPTNFDAQLKRYLDEVYFVRFFFRRGVGWRLSTSGQERFYNTRTQQIEHAIPESHDFIISLPDQVLAEALTNNVLTDLGITMFIRVDTRVNIKLTYSAFLLMGLHDYGHFQGLGSLLKFAQFYLPYLAPSLLKYKLWDARS